MRHDHMTIAILSCVTLQSGLHAQSPLVPADDVRTRFEYRVEPLLDLFQYLRHHATRRGGSQAPAAFADAVSATATLAEVVGRRTLEWEPLDQLLMSCRTAAEFKKACAGLPEPFTKFGGQTISLRAAALTFADVLIAIEPLHREQLWPKHETVIRAALTRIEQQFVPHEQKCIQYMLKSLGMRDPHDVVPVYLTHDVQWPGAYTVSRKPHGGVCFAGVSRASLAGTLLFEIILHEATHALDIVSDEHGSLLIDMRDQLAGAGMSRRDRDFRNIPHTIMFIQAGETIRRFVDPAHKDYGDVNEYYERMGRIATIERDLWKQYLDGQLSGAQAVEKIVAQLGTK